MDAPGQSGGDYAASGLGRRGRLATGALPVLPIPIGRPPIGLGVIVVSARRRLTEERIGLLTFAIGLPIGLPLRLIISWRVGVLVVLRARPGAGDPGLRRTGSLCAELGGSRALSRH